MAHKTIRISIDVYVKLRKSMLEELEQGRDHKTISGFIEGLLDEYNKP